MAGALNKIETVAKALFDKQKDPQGADWSQQWGPTKDHWRQMARTAIEAMREPTTSMESAMNWNGNAAGIMWRAAIDDALK